MFSFKKRKKHGPFPFNRNRLVFFILLGRNDLGMVSTIFPQLLPPKLFYLYESSFLLFIPKLRSLTAEFCSFFFLLLPFIIFLRCSLNPFWSCAEIFSYGTFFLLLSAAKLRVVVVWAIIYLVWVVLKLPAKMELSFYVSAVASSLDTHILTKEEKSRLFFYLGDLLVVMFSDSTKMTSKINLLRIT